MKSFCEFNVETGRLVQRGRCGNTRVPRMREGSAIAFITTSSTADRITFARIDAEGVAVDPVLHKASETEKENRINRILEPRRVFAGSHNTSPEEDEPIVVTKGQWQNVLDRLRNLEK